MRGNGVASARRLRLLHNRSSSPLANAPLPAQRFHQAESKQRRPPFRVPRIASAPPRCRREPFQQSCLVAKQGQKNPQSLDGGLAAELEVAATEALRDAHEVEARGFHYKYVALPVANQLMPDFLDQIGPHQQTIGNRIT